MYFSDGPLGSLVAPLIVKADQEDSSESDLRFSVVSRKPSLLQRIDGNELENVEIEKLNELSRYEVESIFAQWADKASLSMPFHLLIVVSAIKKTQVNLTTHQATVFKVVSTLFLLTPECYSATFALVKHAISMFQLKHPHVADYQRLFSHITQGL